MEKQVKKKASIDDYVELFREIQFAQLKGVKYHLSKLQAKYHIAKDFTKDDVPDLTGYPMTREMAVMLRDNIREKANNKRSKTPHVEEEPAHSVIPPAPVQLDMFAQKATDDADTLTRIENKLSAIVNLLAGCYRILSKTDYNGEDIKQHVD